MLQVSFVRRGGRAPGGWSGGREGVAVIVSTHVRTRHRGGKLYARFSGTVQPARDGAQVAFQRKHGRGSPGKTVLQVEEARVESR